jgi:phosphonate transport system substrate-binding protein
MIRILAAFALVLACSAADLAELNFGLISTESAQGLKKDWEPIRTDLEKAVGLPVKLFIAPDYAGVIEAMRFNKVQLGWFGNKSAIDVVDRASGEVFCQVINSDGDPGYWSLIVVHKDSPLNTLQDLLAKGKDLSFVMGDPQSTSGNLVPGYFAFAKNGVDPQKFFKSFRNGSHESNALAVANKQADAGTFNTEEMFKLERKQPEKAKELKVIWKSDLIASDPICYRTDLSQELKDKIRGFFLAYGSTAEGKANLPPLKMSGFKPSSNNQLLPYRHLGALKEKAKLTNDTTFSAEEKAAKIAELDKKIAELEAKMSEIAKQAK